MNKPLVFKVIEVLTPPKGAINATDIEAAAQKQLFEARQAAKHALEQQNGLIKIDLLAGAPKLILPVDPSSHRNDLLLDMGQLQLNGGLGAGTSTFNASIKDIRIRLSATDRIYDTDRAGSVLDPFGVTATLKINAPVEDTKGEIEGLEPTEEDYAAADAQPPPLVVKCAIDGGITGTISPDKLRDLLYILMELPKKTPGADELAAAAADELGVGFATQPPSSDAGGTGGDGAREEGGAGGAGEQGEQGKLIEAEKAPLVMLTGNGLSKLSSYETKVGPHRRQIVVAAYIAHATLILTTDEPKSASAKAREAAREAAREKE
eukprot:CAMPEP_0119511340 /NCGR_PEP_ID=MMETSP1344-20130328/30023_1 /TAXON_ID=236787 /ORGANISM="Florenciella parvula, Strain CCMP2471" /LENGTH=320 /DNA_ID=CAMNT_0007548337 /DNA_START=18 /DNA_END=977 /DNA_ORIENTATION=+